MSIDELVKFHIERGDLVKWTPIIRGPEVVRQVLVVKDLCGELMDAKNKNETSASFARLQSDLDFFVLGGLTTVAFGKNDNAMIKRLHPPSGEVWAFRQRRPKPSMRLFGRFICRDVFVATNYALRKNLGEYDSREWKLAMRHCRQRWTSTLSSSVHPLKGKKANDYISGKFVETRSL